MPSVSGPELEFVNECVKRVAGNRQIEATCIYGSRVAGYARKDSDIDIIVVLEKYPFGVTYEYFRDSRGKVSALVVGSSALRKDAESAILGEFVIGRLLHIYEPLQGGTFLAELERIYKRRIILEQVKELVASTNILSAEIMFPLEFIHFSKIKRRAIHYPSAAYSYYKTYSESPALSKNVEFTLAGYRRALDSITDEEPKLFERNAQMLKISAKKLAVEKGRARLRLSKSLQQLSSYLVHTYAGLRVMHRSVGEAESKIRRRLDSNVNPPISISNPLGEYCRLPEGILLSGEHGDWLAEYAKKTGLVDYSIAKKQRLGNSSSRTVLYVLNGKSSGGPKKIVVKEVGIKKSIKWSALNVWTAPVKHYSIEPLFLLGSEYHALRYLRQIGLRSPVVEAVVIGRRLIVTEFVLGRTLAELIRGFLRERTNGFFVTIAGEQIAKVHSHGASFGNIKPKNVIESAGSLVFTDVAQFAESENDQPWDVAQFLSWALKGTSNAQSASDFVKVFLEGYQSLSGNPHHVVAKLARSRRHLESFYPVLAPQVASSIRREIRKASSTSTPASR